MNCRICLECESSVRNLSAFSRHSEVGQRIFLISGVKIIDCEGCPALICQQCADDLNAADATRMRCLQADEHFRSMVPQELLFDDTKGLTLWPGCDMSDLSETIKVEPLLHDVIETSAEGNRPKRKAKSFIKEHKMPRTRSKKPKEMFFCSQCFKSFSDRNYLKKHEHYRHSDIPIEDLFVCDICGHTTKSKQLIRNHINSIHPTKPKEKFVCGICGKLLSTKGNLDSHEKTHLEVGLSEYVTCPVCEKAFRQKRFMIEHRKLVHEKSKAFQCPHCPHISTCKGAYNKHNKSVHLKIRDFICSDCGLGFSTNSQLTRHFRIHTGERPYECKSCSKPFRLSSHRKRHEDICPKRMNECS